MDENTAPSDAGPLQGVRVLDFTTMMSGPMCTRLLADLGCDVVKVEAPPLGDHNRRRSPTFDGASRYFAQLNNGKRSIVLDLKKADDLSLALGLATKADVIVENNRPGVMARLGVGYEQVKELNPRIVYASISGYGQHGPASQRPAYAPNINADSGFDMANLLYQPGATSPASTAIFIADAMGALHTTVAVQAALLGRARTGSGQFIDVSLFDAMLNLMVYEMQIAQLGEAPARSVFHPISTTDGFVSVAPITQRMFESLAKVIGKPEIIDDPRWSTQGERERNWDALMQMTADWAREITRDEVLGQLAAVGVAVAPYRTPAEVLADTWLRDRGALVAHHDSGGDFVLFNPPFHFADGSVRARGATPAPGFGAHNDEVIADWLS